MLASVQVNHRPQLSNTRSPECRYCLIRLLFKFLKLFPLLVSYWLGALVKMTTGETLLDEAITQNRGVILAAPHHGCWELYGLYIAARYPLTSLYRPPRLDYLERVMRAGREHTGARLVRTDTDGIRLVVEALNKGQCIGILPDQVPKPGNGVYTPFFASMPTL
jgi:lauroyl/myristoyl acyltransferase